MNVQSDNPNRDWVCATKWNLGIGNNPNTGKINAPAQSKYLDYDWSEKAMFCQKENSQSRCAVGKGHNPNE